MGIATIILDIIFSLLENRDDARMTIFSVDLGFQVAVQLSIKKAVMISTMAVGWILHVSFQLLQEALHVIVTSGQKLLFEYE